MCIKLFSAFNPTPASTGTSLFGQQQQPQQPQQQSTSLFGQSKPLFGASTATGTSGFSGFGTTTSTPSLFGQPTQNKVHICNVACKHGFQYYLLAIENT